MKVRIAISGDQRENSRMTARQNICRNINEYVLCRRTKWHDKKTRNKKPISVLTGSSYVYKLSI